MLKPKKILENVPVYSTDEYFEDWVLKLDSNENLLGPSKRALNCLRNLDCKNVQFYPCYGELLDELVKNFCVNKENILLTNGCDEAISVVLNAYLEAGDKVVSFSPTFAMSQIYTKTAGAEFVEVEYEDKWSFDVNRLIAEAERSCAKVILITSPNSPTGEVVTKDDIVKVLSRFPNSLVLLDNTYINYSDTIFEPAELIKKYPNLFVVKSFSKDFALAGLRLGFVMAQNTQELRKIISPYSVNTLAVLAGLESLRDREHFSGIKKEVTASKKVLTEGLKNLGFKPYESETNFILCDFGEKSEFLYNKLLFKKIKVKNFKQTKNLENCFRISVPDVSGSELLLSALAPKELLVLDLDGVVFDVRNSYRVAIQKTYERFFGAPVSADEIQAAKNLGGLNCDWQLTKYLLEKEGLSVTLDEVVKVFQGFFFDQTREGSKGLIDNEKLILDPELLEKLSETYDFAVFTGRTLVETRYSLEKYGIMKYFSFVVTKESLPCDRQKPCPDGLELIKKCCSYKSVSYFGDTMDDVKSGAAADVYTVGVLPPQDKSDKLCECFKKHGADEVIEDINVILKRKLYAKV